MPCLYRVHERPEPERVARLADQLASLEVPTPPVPDPMSSIEAADLVGAISRQGRRARAPHGRAGGWRSARWSCGRSSRPTTRRSNLGHAGLHSAAYCHFTSPIRRYPDIVCHRALLSAVGGGERQPRAGELAELGVWTSEREREAMMIERDGDDIARCFALEQLLFESGADQVFDGRDHRSDLRGRLHRLRRARGEGRPSGEDEPPFEGMLPVRLLRAPRRRARSAARRAPAPALAARRGAAGRTEREETREWWELNEEGTILRGERTGATLRLATRSACASRGVDTIRGRVDLEPAG